MMERILGQIPYRWHGNTMHLMLL